MADNKVTVSFEVSGDAAAKLAEIAASAKDVNNEFQKGFSGATKAFEVFKGSLASEVVVKGFEKAAEAAKELFDLILTDGIKSAIAEENAIQSLNAALAANGNYSKKASSDIVALAESLEKTTKFSNDAVLSSAALLESLSKLDSAGLQKAVRGAADLASVLGVDLNTAASAIGQAFEGNVGRLKKLGVEIQDTNNKAVLQARIFEALAQRNGLAALSANTFQGATAQLSNAFDNFIKQVGFLITKNPQLIAIIKQTTGIFNDLEDFVKNNKEAISGFIKDGIQKILELAPIVVTFVGFIGKAFVSLEAIFNSIAFAAIGVAKTINEALTPPAGIPGLEASFKSFTDRTTELSAQQEILFKKIQSTDVSFAAIDATTKKVTDTAAAFSVTLNTSTDATKSQDEALKGLSDSIVKVSDDQQKLIDAGKALDQQLSTVQAGIDAQQALIDAQHENQLISDQEYYSTTEGLRQQSLDVQLQSLQAFYGADYAANANYLRDKQILENKANADKLKLQKIQDDKTIQQRDQFLSLASTLQRAKSQELVAIGKAAAITQIAIDTPKAVSGAFAFGSSLAGPALGFTLAAIAATAEAALAAQVAGVGLAGGIDSVPGTGNRDNFPAVLMPGERVVPTTTNKDLTSFLNGSAGMSALLSSIDSKLERLQNQTVVNIGSKTIFSEIRDGLASGRTVTV